MQNSPHWLKEVIFLCQEILWFLNVIIQMADVTPIAHLPDPFLQWVKFISTFLLLHIELATNNLSPVDLFVFSI